MRNSNNYEIEYKYLIYKLPDNIENKKYIEQIYFTSNDEKNELLKKLVNLDNIDNINTFRVRKIIDNNISYVLTLKSKGDLYRSEYECNLSENDYKYLSEEVESIIIKNRYVIKKSFNNDDYTFEFDEYLNLNTDLLTVEVEVDSLEPKYKQDIEYILSNVFKLEYKDITNEKKYKNKYLHETFGTKPIS